MAAGTHYLPPRLPWLLSATIIIPTTTTTTTTTTAVTELRFKEGISNERNDATGHLLVSMIAYCIDLTGCDPDHPDYS
jgi:hypothetical protein